MKPSKEMSSWLIVLVVLLTTFVTTAAMLKYKPSAGSDIPYYYPPQQVAQHLSPGVAALQGGWQFAAATTPIPAIGGAVPAARGGAPVIRAGAVPPHGDLGVCTGCHTVLGAGQTPVPPIQATSRMPHEYRGNCTNCHRIANPSTLNTNTGFVRAAMPMQGAMPIPTAVQMQPATPMQYAMPVAAAAPQVLTPQTVTPRVITPQAMTPQMSTPQTVTPPAMAPRAPAATPATEGEWLGMEVSPITPLTARQYGISEGTQGLVVAEAEVPAAVVGIKAGDVIVAVNGTPTPRLTAFFQATNNGTATQGVVEFFRKGQRMRVNLSSTVVAPPAGAAAGTPVAYQTPQRNFAMPQANTGAWGARQGAGMARGVAPATGWVR